RDALHSFAAERVDVVVTDLALPDEDGYQLLHALHALERGWGYSVPVIAVTGSAMPEDRERVSAAGFALHLIKPVAPAELLEAIAMASSGRAREFAEKRRSQ